MFKERESILIIKEDERIAKLLEHMLKRQGFAVYHVSDVVNAIEFLRENPCTLIIADIPLADKTTQAVFQQMCHMPGHNAGVLLLLEEERDAGIDGLEVLVDECMYKPVRAEVLLSAVKRHIKNVRLERKVEYYRKLAIYDDLTGIYNRRYFNEVIAKEFSRCQRSKQSLSLLMADIDDFKRFNDTYGHRAGDRVLEKVSHELKMSLRGMDVICRYGGEEFVIVLPDTGKKKALWVAERLRLIVEKSGIIVPDQQAVRVTISIGIATYPLDTDDKEELIQCADKALYYAKQSGKNRFCAWNTASGQAMICFKPGKN